ncbi:hypothetical protein [Tenacibaculum adriaticum]|uniref:hypothetical protein n=1 Tax=Tenacibaculum adriaticum TaxID=413713 RepID=UPI0011E62BE6|nr:hypothetical protein [Tenacibaculum adriaticum]
MKQSSSGNIGSIFGSVLSGGNIGGAIIGQAFDAVSGLFDDSPEEIAQKANTTYQLIVGYSEDYANKGVSDLEKASRMDFALSVYKALSERLLSDGKRPSYIERRKIQLDAVTNHLNRFRTLMAEKFDFDTLSDTVNGKGFRDFNGKSMTSYVKGNVAYRKYKAKQVVKTVSPPKTAVKKTVVLPSGEVVVVEENVTEKGNKWVLIGLLVTIVAGLGVFIYNKYKK